MLRSLQLRRPAYAVSALVLAFASLLPFTLSQSASAYGIVGDRYIKISDSTNGFADAIYEVGFETSTADDVGGVVIEFCSNSPIIGDACTAPAGFTVDDDNLLLDSQTGLTGFSVDTTNSTVNRIILTRTPAADGGGTSAVFVFGDGGANGITNPTTTNTTFYGRILTFDTQAGAQQYAPTDIDNGGANTVVDAGGVALSTVAQITVTAKVQERLVFCVYTTGAGNDCNAKSGTAVTLGDENGVLSAAGEFVDTTAKFSIQTNATGDAVVRMKGDTLTSGSYTIDAAGDTALSTPAAPAEFFGMCNYQSAGTGLAADGPYDGGTGDCSTTTNTSGTASTGGSGTAQFAFDTDPANGTGSTYGQAIATKAAGDFSTGTLAFVGQVANTTEAGIYTTTLTFIATGTY